jgi:hypothetical protein
MEKQNTFHEIQIPHIENRALISQRQQAFKAQSSFNRTPVSLNVKIENKDLNNPCENIKIKYYLIGKDLKSKKEYILIGSGEEEIELGSSFSDRKEEIDTNAHINRYSKNTSSKSFKYDSWALAIVARDGQVIKYETSPLIKIDYNKVDAMESRRIYDQSLSPISGIYRSSSGGVFY